MYLYREGIFVFLVKSVLRKSHFNAEMIKIVHTLSFKSMWKQYKKLAEFFE